MDASNFLYLAESEETPESLYGLLDCLPGRVAIAIYRAESRSGVLMPSSGRLGSDIGRVIASGVPEVAIGSEWAVRAADGFWWDDFKGSGYQVRLYGVVDPWDSSLICERRGESLYPATDWTIIERESRQSEILLADEAAFRDDLNSAKARYAKVVYAGPDTGLTPGQRVVYERMSGDEQLQFKFGGEKSWLATRAEHIAAAEPIHAQVSA